MRRLPSIAELAPVGRIWVLGWVWSTRRAWAQTTAGCEDDWGLAISKEGMLILVTCLLLGLLAAQACVYTYLYRGAKRKVRYLQETEKLLREKNKQLEEYAKPSLRHANIIDKGMDQLTPGSEAQRLLKSVEIEADKLEIGEVIGTGSYAEVRRGRYRGTPVGIKTLKAIDDSSLARFRSEILLMKELRHPNIVLLIGASWKTGRLMMVVELFERGNLADVLEDQNTLLSWQQPKYKMLTDIVRGMAYLHSARYYDESTRTYQTCIIHRDLKPQNMLVDSSMGVKITDFGEARGIDNDFTMTQVGTLLYIAPEVVRGERYDEKCDVYSFAVVLLALLQIKRHVFELFVAALHQKRMAEKKAMGKGGLGDVEVETSGRGGTDKNKPRYTPHMVTVAIVNEHLRPKLPDDVPPSLALLIQQSWDPDPTNRPTFKEILEYVETIVQEEIFDPKAATKLKPKEEPAARKILEENAEMNKVTAEQILAKHRLRAAADASTHVPPAANPASISSTTSVTPPSGIQNQVGLDALPRPTLATVAGSQPYSGPRPPVHRSGSATLAAAAAADEASAMTAEEVAAIRNQAAMPAEPPQPAPHVPPAPALALLPPAGPTLPTPVPQEPPAPTLASVLGITPGAPGRRPSIPPSRKRSKNYKPAQGVTALDTLMANNEQLRDKILRMRETLGTPGVQPHGALGRGLSVLAEEDEETEEKDSNGPPHVLERRYGSQPKMLSRPGSTADVKSTAHRDIEEGRDSQVDSRSNFDSVEPAPRKRGDSESSKGKPKGGVRSLIGILRPQSASKLTNLQVPETLTE